MDFVIRILALGLYTSFMYINTHLSGIFNCLNYGTRRFCNSSIDMHLYVGFKPSIYSKDKEYTNLAFISPIEL